MVAFGLCFLDYSWTLLVEFWVGMFLVDLWNYHVWWFPMGRTVGLGLEFVGVGVIQKFVYLMILGGLLLILVVLGFFVFCLCLRVLI